MQILVIKEGHGTYAFQASTPEELDKSCKKILAEKLFYGYYNDDPELKKLIKEVINSPIIIHGKKSQRVRSYELLQSKDDIEIVEVN